MKLELAYILKFSFGNTKFKVKPSLAIKLDPLRSLDKKGCSLSLVNPYLIKVGCFFFLLRIILL